MLWLSDEHMPEKRLDDVEVDERSPSRSVYTLALSNLVSSDRACRDLHLKRIIDAKERRDANSSWQTTLHLAPQDIREL